MSYLHVDAVDQQFPAELSPAQLLILSKFAQLLVSGHKNEFRHRVGRERLVAMTHMDPKTLRKHLKELNQSQYLICLENPKDKRPGDRPLLYEINFPEGFNPDIINQRRLKYYGGKAFCPQYNEIQDDTIERLSTPIPNNEAFATSDDSSPIKEEIAHATEKTPHLTDKSSPLREQIPPSNIPISEKNNNINTVDDDYYVNLAKKNAAEATGASPSAFNNCGITRANAQIAIEAVNAYKQIVKNDPERIKKSAVGYLITLIKKALEAGIATVLISKTSKETSVDATDKKKPSPDIEAWNHLTKELELNQAPGKELDNLKKYFLDKLGNHIADDVPEYIKAFFGDFEHDNGDFNKIRTNYPNISDRISLINKTLDELRF